MTHIDKLYPSVIKSHKIRCQITPTNIASSGALLWSHCSESVSPIPTQWPIAFLLYSEVVTWGAFSSMATIRLFCSLCLSLLYERPPLSFRPLPPLDFILLFFLFCSRIRCLAWIAKGLVLQDSSPSRLRSLAPFIFVACNFGPKPIETFFARGGSQTGCAC